jgi:hypothetical protein
MTLYATLADAKSTMAAGSASSATEDPIVLRNLRVVSRRIDRLFVSRRPYFAPYIESRAFELNPEYINSREGTFRFDDPLLALTGVTVGTEVLTLNTGVKAWPTLTTPIHKLLLVNGSTNWYGYCNDNNEPQLVTIAGTWGYHRDWSNAWMDVTTLSAAIATTSVTTITLTDVDIADAYGRIPGISAGALLKIDDEYLEVTATNTTTNVANVIRGVNGSTAATHLISTTVSVYQVPTDIRDVVARQAGFKYARRGAYENTNIADLGTIQFPPDMLQELYGVLRGYTYG